MTVIEQMQEYASRENAAMRPLWDEPAPVVPPKKSRTRDGLRPLLGSGMTHAQAAKAIGVTPAMVGKILRNEGWTL